MDMSGMHSVGHRPAAFMVHSDFLRLPEELNMRIMGLDFGSKTVGVAVCDPLGITAQTVETITRASENKMRQTLARIEQLIGEYEIERIVLGYPKNMNNTVGERGEKTQEFKVERRTGLEVILWDERLTTVAAERVLIESGVRRENRKKSVDQIAAAMILQGYLDSLQHS
jgi:putative Holliday junction resolvase